MRSKLIITLLTSLIGFGGCGSNNGSGGEDGTETKLGITLKNPLLYGADVNATEQELKIESVDLFIYQRDQLERHQTFAFSDFDDDGDGTYTLKEAKKIPTVTGFKYIYVGLNLPTLMVDRVISGGSSAVHEIATIGQLNNNGFAMFNRADLPVKIEVNSAGASNVYIPTCRVLAKMVVQLGATLEMTAGGGVFSDLQFAVSNNNRKLFLLPDNETFKDPNWDHLTTLSSDFFKAKEADYLSVNPNGTGLELANGVYTTENTSDGIVQNQHTYVSIRAKFTPIKVMKLTIAGDGSSELIADAPILAGTTFYTVTIPGLISYFSSETDANAYATHNSVAVSKYTDGLTYYNVFVNPEPEGDEAPYDVLRNIIYRLTISSIKGIGATEDVDGGTDPIGKSENIDVQTEIEIWAEEDINSEI